MNTIRDLFRKRPLNCTNESTGPTLLMPSVQDLSHSNREPTEHEVDLIRNSIATAKLEIEQLEIKQANNNNSPGFSPYDDQINSYKLFIHLQSALLFRQLPPEILQRIFRFFAEGDENPSSYKPPWVLGHVCQRWRDAAEANPNLWTHLPPIRLGNSCDVPRIYDCLLSLLRRCSGEPISFFLYYEDDRMDQPNPIVALLVDHCRQWEDVSLEVSGITIRRFFPIKNRLNSLHSLEISLPGRGDPVDVFESAPRLRSVRVNNLVSSNMLRLPWRQLTSYEDRTTFGDGVFKAFRLVNSSLRQLKFSPNHDEQLDSFTLFQWTPLTIPHLTTLCIEFWDRRYKIKTLFDNLVLPALQTLVLKFSKYDNVTDIDLVSMITRSRCNLRHFTFHGSGSPIRQYLVVMPSLRILDINDPDPRLIEKLSQSQSGQWIIVRRLKSLIIHLSKQYDHHYLASLSRLAGIRCDTVSNYRQDPPEGTPPSLRMLKSFKVAVHGIKNHSLSHFYYASLGPPNKDTEERSADGIARVYASILTNPDSYDPSTVLHFKLDGFDIIDEDRTIRMESGAKKQRGRIYVDVMAGLTNIIDSDPYAVAGVYVRWVFFYFLFLYFFRIS